MTKPTRRAFLGGAAAAATWRALRLAVPHARLIPLGLVPVATAHADDQLVSLGKPDLTLLNDRPLNAETPAHLLDDAVTPAARMFVRNNGIPPEPADDPMQWQLEISGEACDKPMTLSIATLKKRYESVTLQLQLECGGNGRAEFRPRASGNQWTTGAIACPTWTGVRLADVLADCGVTDKAMYVGFKAADRHLSGAPDKQAISRGIPIDKARQPETLLAFEMNGEPIPQIHGAPLRLVAGGYPGSVSGKWLTGLMIRDRVHDGAKMNAPSYRVPCTPVAPGASVEKDDMCIIESMPVKSLITYPASGVSVAVGDSTVIRGHAWAGERHVSTMQLSTDFGATWQEVSVSDPVNRFAWQHFATELRFDAPGYYEIWAKATDDTGVSQPMLLPGWNPKGYLNNACHRIAIEVVDVA
ncbi:MAG: sulfite oxidase [Pseudomonadota bacterium]